jgi:prepilin-type N-terminal cleavage/methylation domain-containing protein
MLKVSGYVRGEKGYTIIELLIVAAIIGILLAIAIPNLIKARISANEANARKAMQTMRDAEGEFFEQDADNNGTRDFTDFVGSVPVDADDGTLRCPENGVSGGCTEQDALIDNSFVGALSEADGDEAASSDCSDSKAGYCVAWTDDSADGLNGASWSRAGSTPILESDFGWETSPNSVLKTGRRDFGVWGDGVIRCTTSTQASATSGAYETSRDGSTGPPAGACD